jgi:hypothetical protein
MIYLVLSILFAPYHHQNNRTTSPLCAPAQSNLLYIIYSPTPNMFGWLPCFMFIIFALLHSTSKTMGQRPPSRSKPHVSPLSSYSHVVSWCKVSATLRPMHHFLSFFDVVASRPPNKPTSGGAAKPDHGCLAWDHSHRRPGAMSWGCIWPTHGGRGQSRWGVGWRRLSWLLCIFVFCVLCFVFWSLAVTLSTNDTSFLESWFRISQNGRVLRAQSKTYITKPTKC